MLRHASLFSGIGGFDLAAEWAGWENIFHCEWNQFGQKVLAHHFPNSKSYNDITKTDFSIHAGSIDVLTGGFPCQPYSMAGKRLGKEDERHLWPEMLRAIREIKPRWIVGENVLGIISWGGGWFSKKCKLTWKMKATKYKRLYFQLQVSTHRIKDIELGLLLTPTTKEDVVNLETFQKRMEKFPNGTKMPNLATQINSMLPTPSANEDSYRLQGNTQASKCLEAMARKGELEIGKPSQLNPLFVEEMMGFPKSWTELPFLNGETKVSKLTATQ